MNDFTIGFRLFGPHSIWSMTDKQSGILMFHIKILQGFIKRFFAQTFSFRSVYPQNKMAYFWLVKKKLTKRWKNIVE